MKDEERTPAKFMQDLNNTILRDIQNAPTKVCEDTAKRWMRYLKFERTAAGKGWFVDGHERPDVVAYRAVFLNHALSPDILRRMTTYSFDKDGKKTTHPPELKEGEKEVVLITQDESTFYTNEGKKFFWMEGMKKKLAKKGNGESIMTSGFMCPCHGFMVDDSVGMAVDGEVGDNADVDEEATHGIKSFQQFKAGKNREGWFTNDDLVKQLKLAMPLFRKLHPDKHLIFAFDNSMTHRAALPNGLDARKLNLSDGGANVPKLRPTSFKNAQGVTVDQPMQTAAGVQKGVKTILQERGKFKNDQGHDLKLLCHTCKTLKGSELTAHREYSWVTKQCCATRVLSEEPDFANQKEYLAEEVEKFEGCSIIFYPKYHCELNFIEMVWGWTKSYHRRNCTYNFKDLQRELPITYTQRLPLDFVQKAFMYCLRFMSGYREGLVGPELDYAVKKYRGHRCIPVGQKELIKQAFGAKCEKKFKCSGLKRKSTVQ